MRKLLFAAVLLMVSCSKTPQERAQRLVEDYLEQVANDPSSIQDVEVGNLVDMSDTYPKDSGLWASVTWRGKNAYGALVKSSEMVRFERDVTRITHFGMSQMTQEDIDSLLYDSDDKGLGLELDTLLNDME